MKDMRVVATEILNVYINFEYDVESGLYHLRARHYSPFTRTFISPEPTGIDGPNLYWYTRNNPVNLVDPTGEFAIGILGAVTLSGFAFGTGSLIGSYLSGERDIENLVETFSVNFLTGALTTGGILLSPILAASGTIGLFTPIVISPIKSALSGLIATGLSTIISFSNIPGDNSSNSDNSTNMCTNN